MDIEQYVMDKLSNDKSFRLLEQKEQDEAPPLALKITEEADGVFLWVQIVVN
jgi:hypothetical protein